jgi:hydroxymethylglutaryl-CoA reductase
MTVANDSRFPGFYLLGIDERLSALADRGVLSRDGARRLANGEYVLQRDVADKMIENVIGVFGLPFAVAPNFLVNDRDWLVPMVVEEPSIVAGVSGAARLARAGGGFRVHATESLLTGQIQLVDIDDPDVVIQALYAHHD